MDEQHEQNSTAIKRKPVSRRRFLLVAGGVVGAGVLACGGLGAMGLDSSAVDYGQASYHQEAGMKQVLVVYASKCGSTAEVAQKIAERLGSRGLGAEVRPVEDVTDVSGYQAVVLGSAVRMGRWLPAAVKFVQDQAAALRQMPTAFFTVHMLATDDSENSLKERAKYVEPVHAVLKPGNEAFFAGKMDLGKLNLGERLMCKAMRASNQDNRNWQSINAWADNLKLA